MVRSAPEAFVVTGAGRGIGRAVALAVGRTGRPVLCISRTRSAEATSDAIRGAGGSAEALTLAIADHVDTERTLSAWIAQRPHRLIALVLAAAELGPRGPLAVADPSEWARTMGVNLLGNLAVVRGLLARMLDAGFGRMVFFGGGGAAYAYPVFPAYAASKAAVVRAVENLHEDLSDKGDFAAVCLAPGAVET